MIQNWWEMFIHHTVVLPFRGTIQNNPLHQYMLEGNSLGSSLEENDIRVLEDNKLNMIQQCVLAVRRPTASWSALAVLPAGQGR